LVKIKRPSTTTLEHVNTHVIFIHGLKGDVEDTWISGEGSEAEFWPAWLEEELPDVAVWSIGYPADRVKWRGGIAMATQDRATGIFERLLVEQALGRGQIILVGYSMGGVIIKEMLRLAERQSSTNPRTADFERRVRKAAFIATPHLGSATASIAVSLGALFRPTDATRGLNRNNPHLRDLNAWFRDYVTRHRLDVLGLGETLRTVWGKIVETDSSDLGLASPARFILLDVNHDTIVQPPDREADTYVLLKDFVLQAPTGQHADARQASQLGNMDEKLDELLRRSGPVSARRILNPIIDRTAQERIARLRKSRRFVGSDPVEDARQLARDILEGELQDSSAATRASALAWSSRILSTIDVNEADRLLGEARRLASSDEILIASAFIASARGDKAGAIESLSSINTPQGHSARYLVATLNLEPEQTVLWLDESDLRFDDLDADGKFVHMGRLIAALDIPRALEHAERITVEDMDYSPPLQHVVATAHMLAAVPAEKQDMLIDHVPFDWAQFPLKEDADSLEHRRQAREAFSAVARAAGELGCEHARRGAEDFALWLALRDPEGAMAARQQLTRSMSDPGVMVHLVPMAIQFGLPLNRTAIDQAISVVESTEGDTSNDALMARFMLAMGDEDKGAVADFIDNNRERLGRVVSAAAVSAFEIRALADSDRLPEARTRLEALRSSGSASELDISALEAELSGIQGEDTVSALEERFRVSDSLDDLMPLVGRLQQQNEWRRLTPYALELFGRLNDLKSATAYARAAYESEDWPAVIAFLDQHNDFLQRSETLRGILAWSLYRQGELRRARQELASLLATQDNENTRALFINIAITSGDWDALATFVESAWTNKEERTAPDLLRAGQIAAAIGSGRSQSLIREAVSREPSDPEVLVTAYHAAVSGGWENDETVAGWLQTAIEGTDQHDGPIQRMSLDDLMDMRPDWERQESDVWEQLTRGEMPLFLAARRLNRTTISMLLTPALANLDEADPRRRSLFLNYSGRMSSANAVAARDNITPDQTTIALEVTSLLTLSFIDRLSTVLERFRRTVIPHSTLAWLLDERQKVQFHQPTQVQHAHELRNLLAQPEYSILGDVVRPGMDDVDEFGEELAAMLETARLGTEDSRQTVVVRPGPVHRPSTLMRENADLSAYGDVVCGCSEVITALLAEGHITPEEASRANSYLRVHELPWPDAPTIQPGATLLLDDLAVSYLQHLELLSTLGTAGYRVVFSEGHAERVDALIRHESYANATLEHIESVRASLAQGIADGRVIVGPEGVDEELTLTNIGRHPTAGVFALAGVVDLLVVDDRALNKYANIDHEGRSVPIGCSLDLLAILENSGALSASDRTESETRLRRGGFQMMPVRQEELVRLVNAASIQNGEIQENAHLRSIRESIERLRMTNALQIPLDQPWFEQLLASVRESVRAQWNSEVDDATARARSDWLLGLIHFQGWSHSFEQANDRDAITNRFRMLCWLTLSIPLGAFGDTMRRYSSWMEDTLMRALRSEDPASLAWLTEQTRSYIEELARRLTEEESDAE